MMMRKMEKSFWTCGRCESKSTDLKAVLESVTSIKTELAGQQAEREQVLESLKVVEVEAKRLEKIEGVQERQEQQLAKHDDDIKKNAKKGEEGEKRIKKVEEKVDKIAHSGTDTSEAATIRQTNAVVRELREIEKCEKKLIFGNIAESTSESEEAKQKEDEDRVSDTLKEIGMEHIKPVEVNRVGRKAHYARKIQVVFSNAADSQQILERGQVSRVPNGVFIARERTFNQRYEARLYRLEKEKEERW